MNHINTPESKSNSWKTRAKKWAKKTGYGALIGTTLLLSSCSDEDDSKTAKLIRAESYEEKAEIYKDAVKNEDAKEKKVIELTEKLAKAEKELAKAKEDYQEAQEETEDAKEELECAKP